MEDVQQQVKDLAQEYRRDKSGLWELLGEELGDSYQGELPTNLSVDFLKACYSKIDPEDDPEDRLQRCHDNYSRKWKRDKTEQAYFATALKYLLHERVGRDIHNVIKSPTVRLLSQLVVAMRVDSAQSEYVGESELNSAESEGPPTRSTRPIPPFEDTLSFEYVSTPRLERWIAQRRAPDAGDYAVYVLDCTPAIGDSEDNRIRTLREEVHHEGTASKPREKAAQAANNDECVYYVGYTADLVDRMRHRHAKGASYGGAAFLTLFQPRTILDVTWHETKSAAKSYERKRSIDLTQSGGPYAFSELNV